MSTPKKHHYVPICYLSPFTNTQKVFWKRRNDNGKISITSPGKVCYEIDANRFRHKEAIVSNNIDDDEYYVEKNAFKYQESNYGKVIGSIANYQNEPRVIDKKKYHLFLETLITMKRRNPSSREEIINAYKEGYKTEEGIQNLLQFVSEETGMNKFTPELEKYIRAFASSRSQSEDHLHDMYLSAFIKNSESSTVAEIVKDLYQLKQYILHPLLGQQFITSDNPGFINCGNYIGNIRGFGGDYHFYFPLSPTSCLFLKSNDHECPNITEKAVYHQIIGETGMNFINNSTISLSMNQIFAYRKEPLEKIYSKRVKP